MNNHQTLLVQKSSQQSIPIAEQVALLFYDRLVAPNPPLSTDSNRQEKIMIQKRNPAITFFHRHTAMHFLAHHFCLVEQHGMSEVQEVFRKIGSLGSHVVEPENFATKYAN